MAIIKGGYATMDVTDIFLSASEGVTIPDWQETLKRIYKKPVLCDAVGSQFWFSTYLDETMGYVLVGSVVNPGEISLIPVVIGPETASSTTIKCMYAE